MQGPVAQEHVWRPSCCTPGLLVRGSSRGLWLRRCTLPLATDAPRASPPFLASGCFGDHTDVAMTSALQLMLGTLLQILRTHLGDLDHSWMGTWCRVASRQTARRARQNAGPSRPSPGSSLA